MTLCTAWIRQSNDTEELIFATDSCLTGGEKWKHGIKLFELPRKDCLLCFAGSTIRAYPLILNFISSIHLDKYLESPSASIEEVLDFLAEMFTKLVNTIISEIPGEDIHELRSNAKFLFGGWDWQKGQSGAFRVWNLYYSKEVEGFIFDEVTIGDNKTKFYTFMGDAEIDVEKEAKDRFRKLVYEQDKQDEKLDMEPLEILRDISLDKDIREVDGSLQIAKIYKSNRTEFFGIYWESSKGKPCFQGREYNEVNKPLVRYFNPDTLELLETDIPEQLIDMTVEVYGIDVDFILECYPEGNIKSPISEKEKHMLKLIFKEVAYRQFLESQSHSDTI